MNIQSKSPRSNINWKQIAIIALVLGVAGFQYYKSHQDAGQNAGQNGDTAELSLPDQIDLDGHLDKNSQASDQDLKFKPIQGNSTDFQNSSSGNSSSGNSFLKTSPNGDKVSPAGLVYKNRRHEHRTEHVLRHASDQPKRSGSHGVFDANGDDVFRLLDEAYKMIQDNSRQVSKDKPRQDDNGRVAYVINMNRRIGYRGGQSGNRAGKPEVSKIKLVLENGNQVITAYPF